MSALKCWRAAGGSGTCQLIGRLDPGALEWSRAAAGAERVALRVGGQARRSAEREAWLGRLIASLDGVGADMVGAEVAPAALADHRRWLITVFDMTERPIRLRRHMQTFLYPSGASTSDAARPSLAPKKSRKVGMRVAHPDLSSSGASHSWCERDA